jgi:hypothetical protein
MKRNKTLLTVFGAPDVVDCSKQKNVSTSVLRQAERERMSVIGFTIKRHRSISRTGNTKAVVLLVIDVAAESL